MKNLLKTSLGLALVRLFDELASLADRKQQDYGSRNLTQFGQFGVLVRASDKLARLQTLIEKARDREGPSVSTETIEDTWRDLANYGAIGALMAGGQWNGDG